MNSDRGLFESVNYFVSMPRLLIIAQLSIKDIHKMISYRPSNLNRQAKSLLAESSVERNSDF